MNITITAKDTITPDLQKKLRALQNRRPALEAAGQALVGIAQRAFNNASLRAAAWPPKKDGSTATLKSKAGTLWRSIRVTGVTNDSVTVGSDRPYAAIHQLGGKTRPHVIRPKNKKALAFAAGGGKVVARSVNHPGSNIPARPFFPFLNGVPTEKARRDIGSAIRVEIDKSFGRT